MPVAGSHGEQSRERVHGRLQGGPDVGAHARRPVVSGAGGASRPDPGRVPSRPAALDVALDGPGFLVVKTPAGERLTRGGSLKLDAGGQLTDGDSNPVLGNEADRTRTGRARDSIGRHGARGWCADRSSAARNRGRPDHAQEGRHRPLHRARGRRASSPPTGRRSGRGTSRSRTAMRCSA